MTDHQPINCAHCGREIGFRVGSHWYITSQGTSAEVVGSGGGVRGGSRMRPRGDEWACDECRANARRDARVDTDVIAVGRGKS